MNKIKAKREKVTNRSGMPQYHHQSCEVLTVSTPPSSRSVMQAEISALLILSEDNRYVRYSPSTDCPLAT